MKKQYLSDGIISIEFIGLPSSGKTRFSERLLKELNAQHIPTYSIRNFYSDMKTKNYKLLGIKNPKYLARYHFFRFFVKNTNYCFNVFSRLVSNSSLNLNVKLVFLRIFIKEAAAWNYYHNNHNSGFYICDEGFIHRLLTYGYSKKLKISSIKSYINKCPRSNLVVILNHDFEEIKNNRNFASDPFCQILNINDETKRISELRSMRKNLDLIIPNLRQMGLKIIELNSNTTEDQFLTFFHKTLNQIK